MFSALLPVFADKERYLQILFFPLSLEHVPDRRMLHNHDQSSKCIIADLEEKAPLLTLTQQFKCQSNTTDQ